MYNKFAPSGEERETLFSGQGHNLKAKWTKFMKEWWKICKKQDSLSCIQFDSEWEGLLSLIKNMVFIR